MGVFNLTDVTKTPGPAQGDTDKKQEDANTVKDSGTTVSDASIQTGKNATVSLDGPLSQVYAKALMIAYSREDIAAIVTSTPTENYLKAQAANDPDDLYVYCTGVDEMDSEEASGALTKLRVAMDSKRYKTVMLAIESHGHVSTSAARLAKAADAMGVKVSRSRSSALDRIGMLGHR